MFQLLISNMHAVFVDINLAQECNLNLIHLNCYAMEKSLIIFFWNIIYMKQARSSQIRDNE